MAPLENELCRYDARQLFGGFERDIRRLMDQTLCTDVVDSAAIGELGDQSASSNRYVHKCAGDLLHENIRLGHFLPPLVLPGGSLVGPL